MEENVVFVWLWLISLNMSFSLDYSTVKNETFKYFILEFRFSYAKMRLKTPPLKISYSFIYLYNYKGNKPLTPVLDWGHSMWHAVGIPLNEVLLVTVIQFKDFLFF